MQASMSWVQRRTELLCARSAEDSARAERKLAAAGTSKLYSINKYTYIIVIPNMHVWQVHS